MNEGISKFKELLLTDKEFQAKLKTAAENYDGEQTEEAMFEGILIPLASEYGISATLDELRDFQKSFNDSEMNSDELQQVAGASKGDWETYGFGGTLCIYGGVGIGGSGGGGSQSGCLVIGGSNTVGGGMSECVGYGISGNPGKY